MAKTSTKLKPTGTSPANGGSRSKRTARFALYDQHLARAKIFRLHGRGAGSSKHAHLDWLTDLEIARRVNSRDPKLRVTLPPVTLDVVEPRHDPALCAPDAKLTLLVTSVYPVGAAEETLLLVLLSLAGKKRHDDDRKAGVILTSSPNRDLAVRSIGAKGDGMGETILAIHVSRRRLLDELSLDGGGKGYEYLKARLRRLRWIGYDATLIEGNSERAWGGSQLLSYDLSEDDPDALIKINLCERFARVLIGAGGTRRRAPYERIDLDERFSLRSDAARLIHKMISVDVPAQSGRQAKSATTRTVSYQIDDLAEILYPLPDGPLTKEAIWKRRHDLKAAFSEIAALAGWSVRIDRDTVTVSRKGDSKPEARKRARKGMQQSV